MDSHAMTSLITVVGISFFIPIVLQRFNLKLVPVVVAEIAAGLMIGKSGLNIVAEDPWLNLLSTLGFLFLLFLSGLEINFDTNEFQRTSDKSLPPPFLLGLGIFGLILVVSFTLSFSLFAFGLVEETVLMTLIITTVSLGVVLPVLKERQLLSSHFGQTILMVAMIADFATMLFLSIFLMVRANELLRIPLLLILFMAMFIFYRFIKRYVSMPFFDSLMKTTTVQLGTRGVFALVLLFAGLSERLGAEAIFGAFLAGIIISLLSPPKEFRHQLDSFGYGFLIPIFFVMVGVRLDLQAIIQNETVLLLMPVLLLYMYVAKLIPSLVLARWYPWKTAIGAGILSTSKLSLVIAAAAIAFNIGIIDEALNGALILVAVTTCLISPVLFNKLVPIKEAANCKIYSIIGANSLTLPLALELSNSPNKIKVYSDHHLKRDENHDFEVNVVSSFSYHTLEKTGAYAAHKMIIASEDDEINVILARRAAELGVEDIVVKVDDEALEGLLTERGIRVYSQQRSSTLLLKAMVDHPAMVTLLSHGADTVREIELGNRLYDSLPLKQIPFLGDALILHIVREGEFILPHGNTRVKAGDHLLVSGSKGSLDTISEKLS